METKNPEDLISTQTQIPPKEEEVIITDQKVKKKINLYRLIFPIIIILLIIISLIQFFPNSFKLGKKSPSPTPIVEVTPTPEIINNQSPYATDSAILSSEEDLQILEKKLKETNFSEPSLLPPQIDMNVRFDVQE